MVVIFLVMLFAGVVFNVFRPFHKLLSKKEYVYIDDKTNFDQLVDQLQDKAHLSSPMLFTWIAKGMGYPSKMKTGRYAVDSETNMLTFLHRLSQGRQVPVSLTFNNVRTKADLAGKLSKQLMIDSIALLQTLNDSVTTQKLGFTTDNVVAMFIPNTYEIYWNIPMDKFLQRMKSEYTAFWTDARKGKAQQMGLTPVEIATLASIVEEEARYADEYPIVAGLYWNRLQKGMRLEADPTVKFAAGDFSLRRILHEHLLIDSPYNTYRNTGLPPGPIRIPSIKGMDAVLAYQQHRFLFMCAKEDLSGRHNFAETFAQHAQNAERYRKALNERGIMR